MSDSQYRWLTAFVILGAAAPSSGRADWITPDSAISPPAVSSASDGSPVAPGGWATDQYQGQGLVFPMRMNGVDTGTGTAVVRVNGSDAWTGATYADGGFLSDIAYNSQTGLTADLVQPGTNTPTFADVIQVKIAASGYGTVYLSSMDKNGNPLLDSASVTPVADGATLTVSGQGLTSFNVYGFASLVPQILIAGSGPPTFPPPFVWEVAAVQFDSAPEPAGLALGAVGVFGLIGFAWRRRRA